MKNVVFAMCFITLFLSPPSYSTENGGVVGIDSIVSLCHPGKLSTLKKGNRAANQRFRKLMYYAHSYQDQMSPDLFFKSLYSEIKTPPYANKNHVFAPKTEILNLTAQYRLGRIYGLYTEENLTLLRRGRAPTITKGEHSGQKAHVDHILPMSKYPELENSMANLRWIPAKLNMRKSDEVTNASKRRAKDLEKETGWQSIHRNNQL